jgi:hypothetical protein
MGTNIFVRWCLVLSFFGTFGCTKFSTPSPTPGPALFVDASGSDDNPGTQDAPFATLQKARDAVRAINSSMTSDINVYIRGGRYPLWQTLTFDQGDSGTNGYRVIYQAYPGEIPHISGGQKISGWTSAGNGLYKTNVGGLRFRQLYVNDARATRARTPSSGTFYNTILLDEQTQTLIIEANKISSWANLNQVEVHIMKAWDVSIFRIASFTVSGDQAIVVPMEPERTLIFNQAGLLRAGSQPYFFENAMEFLNGEGQWYLNNSTGDLYYYPKAGEDMSTAEVIAPNVERLISVQGTLDAPVQNLLFYGLTLEHSTYLDPNSQGYIGMQASVWGWDTGGIIPVAIYLSNAEHIQFERSVFQHMGGSAIGLDSGTHYDSLIGNVFTDISSNGIAVDMTMTANPADSRVVPLGNEIRDNYITQVGQQYEGAVGIMTAYTSGTIIEHNEVSQIPYTGIPAGWGWSHDDTQLSHNVVRYNNVHNVMYLFEDGGGIYTLSKQPGSFVSENFVHDITIAPWADYGVPLAFYLDAGSEGITVANNVIQNVQVGLSLQGCCGLAFGNTIINLPPDVVVMGNIDGNTFLTDSTLFPADVVANAGIEPSYRDILNGGPAKPLGPVPTSINTK